MTTRTARLVVFVAMTVWLLVTAGLGISGALAVGAAPDPLSIASGLIGLVALVLLLTTEGRPGR